MKLVIDNNILISLLNPASFNSYLFSSLKASFYAPDYALVELEKHRETALAKSGLSEQQFEMHWADVLTRIRIRPLEEYKKLLGKAVASLPDLKDSPYLALAILLGAGIWSNDAHFKEQADVPAFTTGELYTRMLGGEL